MKITNFDTSLLHHDKYYESDELKDSELGFLFSKLIYALNQLSYKSRDLWLDPVNEDNGVVLSAESGFWAVSYIESGQRTPSALFLDIEDAVEFFLRKLTNGHVTSEVVEKVAENGWKFQETERIQRGLYSSFRVDLLGLDHQKGAAPC